MSNLTHSAKRRLLEKQEKEAVQLKERLSILDLARDLVLHKQTLHSVAIQRAINIHTREEHFLTTGEILGDITKEII